MAKSAYLGDFKKIIHDWIFEIYESDRTISAKGMLDKINERLVNKAHRQVSISTIQGTMTELHNLDKAGKLDTDMDNPWSIGACIKYNIPSEDIRDLITTKRLMIHPESLSIRKARWFSRLSSYIFLMDRHYFRNIATFLSHRLKESKHKGNQIDETYLDTLLKFANQEKVNDYELAIMRITAVLLISQEYASKEKIEELEGTVSTVVAFDSSDVDDLFFIHDDDITTEDFASLYYSSIMPPQFKEDYKISIKEMTDKYNTKEGG